MLFAHPNQHNSWIETDKRILLTIYPNVLDSQHSFVLNHTPGNILYDSCKIAVYWLSGVAVVWTVNISVAGVLMMLNVLLLVQYHVIVVYKEMWVVVPSSSSLLYNYCICRWPQLIVVLSWLLIITTHYTWTLYNNLWSVGRISYR